METDIKTINIMVNNECNLKCPHCDLPTKYAKYNNDLSVKAWDKLLDKLLPQIKPSVLAVASREPLMPHSQAKTAAIMEAGARHKVASCGFVTNGYFASDFWDKYPNLRVNYMDISVDGPPEINAKTRGPKHFPFVENFLRSQVYRNKADKLFISTALTKWTAPRETLSRFIDWVKKTLDKPRMVLLVLYPNEHVDKTLHLEDDNFLKILDLLIKESRNFEDLFLDMFPSSLPGLAKMIENGVLPKDDEFIRDDSGMLYGHIAENLYLRIENHRGLEKYHLRISPEGCVIPVKSIARKDYLRGNHGNLLRENWNTIQKRIVLGLSETLPTNCVGRPCANICNGENHRCPILV